MNPLVGKWHDYKFEMTVTPPLSGPCYLVTFTPFWRRALRAVTILHDWIGEKARKSATYAVMRGPEDGLYIDDKPNPGRETF